MVVVALPASQLLVQVGRQVSIHPDGDHLARPSCVELGGVLCVVVFREVEDPIELPKPRRETTSNNVGGVACLSVKESIVSLHFADLLFSRYTRLSLDEALMNRFRR